jgi:hypothetical protein
VSLTARVPPQGKLRGRGRFYFGAKRALAERACAYRSGQLKVVTMYSAGAIRLVATMSQVDPIWRVHSYPAPLSPRLSAGFDTKYESFSIPANPQSSQSRMIASVFAYSLSLLP